MHAYAKGRYAGRDVARCWLLLDWMEGLQLQHPPRHSSLEQARAPSRLITARVRVVSTLGLLHVFYFSLSQ